MSRHHLDSVVNKVLQLTDATEIENELLWTHTGKNKFQPLDNTVLLQFPNSILNFILVLCWEVIH